MCSSLHSRFWLPLLSGGLLAASFTVVTPNLFFGLLWLFSHITRRKEGTGNNRFAISHTRWPGRELGKIMNSRASLLKMLVYIMNFDYLSSFLHGTPFFQWFSRVPGHFGIHPAKLCSSIVMVAGVPRRQQRAMTIHHSICVHRFCQGNDRFANALHLIKKN